MSIDSKKKNRLFILGAGASKDHSSGIMPTTDNFLKKAREGDFFFWRPTPYPFADANNFQDTEKIIKRLFGINQIQPGDTSAKEKETTLKRVDQINIEELLTLATIFHQVDPRQPSEDNIIQLILKTIDYYSEKVTSENGIFNKFVEGLNGDKDSIISFNWDILLDQLLPNYSPEPHSIPFSFYGQFINICTAEQDDSWKSPVPYVLGQVDSNRRFKRKFGGNYIKLHGSVDLVNCKNNTCENNQKPFVATTPKDRNCCGICHELLYPYIIPPIQNKAIRDTHYIRRSWTRTFELCQEADQVIFWGYSLPVTDYWANLLVKKVWGGNCKEIIIINPSVQFQDGKPNGDFVKRFCPDENVFQKKISKKLFRYFKDYLKDV